MGVGSTTDVVGLTVEVLVTELCWRETDSVAGSVVGVAVNWVIDVCCIVLASVGDGVKEKPLLDVG